MSETLGLKNVNLLTKEQYNRITQPATDELYAISGSGFGFPSKRYVDLTLGATDSDYTAPANGWFVLNKTTTAANQKIGFYNSTSQLQTTIYAGASGKPLSVFIPAKKGEKVKVSYDAAGTTNRFRFIYAEGEE